MSIYENARINENPVVHGFHRVMRIFGYVPQDSKVTESVAAATCKLPHNIAHNALRVPEKH